MRLKGTQQSELHGELQGASARSSTSNTAHTTQAHLPGYNGSWRSIILFLLPLLVQLFHTVNICKPLDPAEHAVTTKVRFVTATGILSGGSTERWVGQDLGSSWTTSTQGQLHKHPQRAGDCQIPPETALQQRGVCSLPDTALRAREQPQTQTTASPNNLHTATTQHRSSQPFTHLSIGFKSICLSLVHLNKLLTLKFF